MTKEIFCWNCQEKLEKEQAERRDLLNCFSHMCKYFWNELGWCHFRAEFVSRGNEKYEKVQFENARIIASFINECEEKWPELKSIIEAAK